jgi:acylphosphatase
MNCHESPRFPGERAGTQTSASAINPNSMNKTYKLRITGKVQGVWYRASAKEKALSLGLTGKIWNAPDGNVEAIVQGPEEKIRSFIEWCKKGPSNADVENVHVTEVSDDSIYSGFKIVNKG